jgi:glycosyltransferase involved in cell wall biosynthesis
MQAAALVGDEVLVVDSFSEDQTVSIAKAHGATRIEMRAFKNWADQRNWAMEQSQHPWVLFIDADEVLDEQLIKVLQQWKSETHTNKEQLLGAATHTFFSWVVPCVFPGFNPMSWSDYSIIPAATATAKFMSE